MRLLLLACLFVLGCRTVEPNAVKQGRAENLFARRLLCGDVGEEACLAACSNRLRPREHTECLMAFRFGADPQALTLARELYKTNAMVGIDVRQSIDGLRGEDQVKLMPALPVGEHRRHLEWLHASLASFDTFVGALAAHAPRPVEFEPRPRAFVFYRTDGPAYPSAYSLDGFIAYNLEGPLHTAQRSVLETLFHELFHVNDARRETWSERVLQPVFDAIVERCGDDHDCFRPYAPFDTVIDGGTFYGFDRRARDVREYAAELALRYFVEHEALLAGERPKDPPFKCLTPENGIAWDLISREFFGGADLQCCDP